MSMNVCFSNMHTAAPTVSATATRNDAAGHSIESVSFHITSMNGSVTVHMTTINPVAAIMRSCHIENNTPPPNAIETDRRYRNVCVSNFSS